MQIDPMDFVVQFLRYYDDYGIQDHLNKTTNRMETSDGIYKLVQLARQIAPKRLGKGESAVAMRRLEEEQRDAAIKAAKDRVVDMRNHFAKEMAANQGTRGLVLRMVEAKDDPEKLAEIIRVAEIFKIYEDGKTPEEKG